MGEDNKVFSLGIKFTKFRTIVDYKGGKDYYSLLSQLSKGLFFC